MALPIKAWRAVKGLNQTELAEKCGVTMQTISNWERNPVIMPVEKALILADVFGITLNDILFLPEVSTKCSKE